MTKDGKETVGYYVKLFGDYLNVRLHILDYSFEVYRVKDLFRSCIFIHFVLRIFFIVIFNGLRNVSLNYFDVRIYYNDGENYINLILDA